VKDYLPVTTIKSYFSRRAKKIRTGQITVGETQDADADEFVFDGDDENDEEDVGNEDVDNSLEREKTTTVIQHMINNAPNLETDDWVAVAFPRAWYPGQFIRYDEESREVFVNFLERTSSNSKTFIWPALNSKEDDKSWVEEGMNISIKIGCYAARL